MKPHHSWVHSRAGKRWRTISGLSLLRTVLCGFILAFSFPGDAASLLSDWQKEQHFTVPAPGLVKLTLPVETLDASRAALEDLRLLDDAGNEIPCLISRNAPAGRINQGAKSFRVSLSPGQSMITIETGLKQTLDGVTLESPAASFIKSVQVEGSTDGQRWQPVARGLPIFRQPNGASQLRLAIPAGAWAWLRLTIDDQRSQPIPFTGASVQAAAGETTPSELLTATVTGRHENPGETRLTVNLGAANLQIVNLQLETSEPLFARQVTLAVPQVSEDSIREQIVAQGMIYRVAVEGQPASTNLSVPLEGQVRSRELLVLIRNQDSPPLPITAIRVERRPVHLVFLAKQSGTHHLLTGNPLCPVPRYDLAVLGSNLKSLAPSPIPCSPLTGNPGYRPPEVLSGIQDAGAALDVSAWKYRKPVKLARGGAQQMELDLPVLSHAQPDFQDLRLLRGDRQVPYIIERTSINRALTPIVTPANDPKNPKLSRWMIKLPHPALPLTRLICTTPTPLFQRDVTLFEEIAGERGETFRVQLGGGTWIQTPGRASQEFTLALDRPPRTDTLFLETNNGDNPPIDVATFQVFHPATRLLLKTKPGEGLFLYYGNPHVPSPRYDLRLVAGELLTADKAAASLGDEEQLLKSSWSEGRTTGNGSIVFWGVLALVVVVLLIVISKLLPKSAPPA